MATGLYATLDNILNNTLYTDVVSQYDDAVKAIKSCDWKVSILDEDNYLKIKGLLASVFGERAVEYIPVAKTESDCGSALYVYPNNMVVCYAENNTYFHQHKNEYIHPAQLLKMIKLKELVEKVKMVVASAPLVKPVLPPPLLKPTPSTLEAIKSKESAYKYAKAKLRSIEFKIACNGSPSKVYSLLEDLAIASYSYDVSNVSYVYWGKTGRSWGGSNEKHRFINRDCTELTIEDLQTIKFLERNYEGDATHVGMGRKAILVLGDVYLYNFCEDKWQHIDNFYKDTLFSTSDSKQEIINSLFPVGVEYTNKAISIVTNIGDTLNPKSEKKLDIEQKEISYTQAISLVTADGYNGSSVFYYRFKEDLVSNPLTADTVITPKVIANGRFYQEVEYVEMFGKRMVKPDTSVVLQPITCTALYFNGKEYRFESDEDAQHVRDGVTEILSKLHKHIRSYDE